MKTNRQQTTTHNSQLTTLLILSMMLLLSVRGWGQTIIPSVGNPSIITTNTTWSDPVYYVYDDISIEQGATLTITLGTQVIFYNDLTPTTPVKGQTTKTGIFIQGQEGSLIINGTQSQMVTLTANDIILGWEGIIFINVLNNPYSEINYSIIEYVKKTDGACGANVKADGAIFINDFNNITIQNSIIRNNSISKRGGAIFIAMEDGLSIGSPNGQINILSNQIYRNTAAKGGGICLFTGGNPIGGPSIRPFARIENNQISENTAHHSGGGICVLKEADANIKGNSIIHNIANCATTIPVPTIQGGGGISISFLSQALIEDNIIENNESNFYSGAASGVSTGVGGGILVCTKSEASIINNQISTNYAYLGGGIAAVNGTAKSAGIGPSKLTLSNNYIRTNEAYHGGGIYVLHSHGVLDWNDINDNTAVNGGGLFLHSTTDSYGSSTDKIVVNNSIIRYNNAIRGAGIWIDGESQSSPLSNKFEVFNNLIIKNNSSAYAAATYIGNNINLAFHNNTVSNNYTSTSNDGDGIYVEPISNNNTLSFINNIVYFNGLTWSECQINQYPFAPNEYSFNNILHLGCAIDPTNNFDFPPEFVDAVNDDYRLLPSSLLIDLGDNNVLPIAIVDLDNYQRIVGIIDLGAYEYKNSGIRASKPDSIEYLIYPNPAASNITVAFPQTQINVLIEIFSLEGKKLLEKHFSDKSSINLDISHLPNGVYLLQTKTDRDVFTDKFIKN